MRECVSSTWARPGCRCSARWQLYCLEHRIQPDGTVFGGQGRGAVVVISAPFLAKHQLASAFPGLSVDLEPTVLDAIRTGTYRRPFHPEQLISGKEDAANNYAQGHCTVGKEIIDMVLERI